jgi:hypothetical protein
MTPLLGFAPDADLMTPGLLADCTNLVPTLKGMAGGPSAVAPAGASGLTDPCQGAAVVTKLDGTRRILAGTQDGIYELLSGAWVDQSGVGGYNGGATSRWSIAQFGDAALMANRADPIQRSTSGAFADIAGAPRAEVVFSVGAFVMALNVNDGAEKPDGWHCCAAYDDTDWAESTTTQSASGRLVATPGALTAGARLGEYAVAYKARSMFLGQYVGAPAVWDWTQVSGGDAGCVGKKAICDIDGVHFFVGEDNFWLFDGTRPVPLADGTLRDWFQANSNPSFRFLTECVYNRSANQVWIFYPSIGSQELDHTLVYHVKSKKWGRANRMIQASLEYVSPAATIDGLTDYAATIDTLPDVGLDSQYWLSGGRSLSVFNETNQLVSLSGDSDASALETGDAGDDSALTLFKGLRLRFVVAPNSATLQTLSKRNSGDSYLTGPSTTLDDGKFDVLVTNRWHRARVQFTGPVHVTHIKPNAAPAGQR